MQQLETLDFYLDSLPGGSDPDPDFAAKVSGSGPARDNAGSCSASSVRGEDR